MNKKQRRRLKDLLARLDTGERNRLTRRADKLRKVALRGLPHGARRPELDDFRLLLLDAEQEQASGFAAEQDGGGAMTGAAADGSRGVVVALAAGTCRVVAGGDLLDLVLPGDLARRQKSGLTVGDEVLLEHGSAVAGQGARRQGSVEVDPRQ